MGGFFLNGHRPKHHLYLHLNSKHRDMFDQVSSKMIDNTVKSKNLIKIFYQILALNQGLIKKIIPVTSPSNLKKNTLRVKILRLSKSYPIR